MLSPTLRFLALMTLVPSAPAAVPLVDGRCDDYGVAGARAEVPTAGVILHQRARDGSLWLCATVPKGSLPVLDLRLHLPGGPVVLHVSRQLGEWPGDASAWWTGPARPDWWVTPGWTAMPLRWRGPGVPQHLAADGVELQLSAARFGPGPLRADVSLQGLAGIPAADGRLLYTLTLDFGALP
jgi:hypothetical protein